MVLIRSPLPQIIHTIAGIISLNMKHLILLIIIPLQSPQPLTITQFLQKLHINSPQLQIMIIKLMQFFHIGRSK